MAAKHAIISYSVHNGFHVKKLSSEELVAEMTNDNLLSLYG